MTECSSTEWKGTLHRFSNIWLLKSLRWLDLAMSVALPPSPMRVWTALSKATSIGRRCQEINTCTLGVLGVNNIATAQYCWQLVLAFYENEFK
eukprot:1365004-Alexandrium_andersonii.AAC.1